jgi:hypothetical protein
MKSQGYAAKAMGQKAENEEAITKLALDYRIMSEYTSFVAVDNSVSNDGKNLNTVRVPIDMADGVIMGSVNASPTPGRFRSNNATLMSPKAVGGLVRGGSGGAPGAPASSFGVNSLSASSGRSGGIDFIAYDPTDNSLVLEGKANEKRVVKIAKGLLEAKGLVAIRISVAAISQTRLELLRKAGLKVGSHDGATLVFGTASATTIRTIAKLEFVRRIAWLRAPKN